MNNSSTTNQSSDEKFSFGLEPKFWYPVAAFYIAITAVAIVGNLLVCYAILANRNLRNNPTNLLLLSLAVSDFLTVTLVAPFDIDSLFVNGVWNHGLVMCIIWQLVYLITVPISILSLLAISVERYKTLSDPLGRFRRSQFITQKKALLIIVIIWIYSILWALFPFMGWRGKGEPLEDGECMLPYTMEYNILSSFLNIILPLLITCLFYILIYRIASKHSKFNKRGGFPSCQKPTKEESKMYLKNLKAAKTTAMFVLALFICWQPYSWFVIAESIDYHNNPKAYPFEVYLVLLMLGFLNSALNPFLFAFRNKRFQVAYRKLFTSLKPTVKSAESGLSLRRISTVSQSTVTSEIPELGDGVVRLRSISYYED